MTREEEIIEASKEYSLNRFNIRPDVVQDCFIEGAKWADKTMIEKACKWLEDIDFAEKAYWIIANINSDDAQLVGLTDTLKELRQLLTIADALSTSIIIQLKRQEL